MKCEKRKPSRARKCLEIQKDNSTQFVNTIRQGKGQSGEREKTNKQTIPLGIGLCAKKELLLFGAPSFSI